ncbi:MAG: hypothetical protein QW451_00705 [Candidatus Aenigmatarchaeota archaeon]
MNFKLLAIMVGIIFLVFLIAIVGSIVTGKNLSILGLLVPIGLFTFVVYKFKKEGVVSILLFVGGLMIMGSFISVESLRVKLIGVFIGLILEVVAFLLAKIWGVMIFK